jgi:PIN domain nuclease of toxin-antitoxin system
MNLLLDTHVVLRLLAGDKALKAQARRTIEAATTVYVSSITPWEVTIKAALGKLDVDLDRFDAEMAHMALTPLPITWAHTRALRRLPRLHGDPFDRMLIAQAISEPMQLLTSDAALAAYGPQVTVV